jgi:integrase/recombinase XerD
MKPDDYRSEPLFFSMTYEFLEIYLPRQCGRSRHTIESYRDGLSLFRRYLLQTQGISISRFTFDNCSRECVLGFMQYLADLGNKPGTRNHRLAALKSYIRFAADKDVALQSKALEIRRIPRCKEPFIERQVIPEEAMAALLCQPPNTKIGLRDRTLMILLYDSGARLGEILGLSVSDAMIEGENTYIRINGKGGKQRVVPISVKTAAHLTQYISIYHAAALPKTNFLFFTVIKNTVNAMSESNVERFMAKYAKEAHAQCISVPSKVHPHMFRRTRATQLYQNGVALPLVSRILGHASLQTTQLYAKPSIEMLRRAMESVQTPDQQTEKPIWITDETVMAKLSGLR